MMQAVHKANTYNNKSKFIQEIYKDFNKVYLSWH